MMRRSWMITGWMLLALFALNAPMIVEAQEGQTQPTAQPTVQPTSLPPGLVFFTDYPSQVIGIGETVTMDLILRTGSPAQVVNLDMKQTPEGWTATFRGQGKIIQSVYVQPGTDSTVQLRLEPPDNVAAGNYNFVVEAKGNGLQADLPIVITVKEKLPPRLSLSVDLPTLKGTPSTTFRYNATLKNEGDEDLSVNLTADAPTDFQVTFNLAGQEVNSFPLPANESKQVSIEAKPVSDISAGNYPITVLAQGGSAQASLDLSAQVTGQANLSITAPNDNLSAQAYTGRQTPLKVIVRNTGTAPAQGIKLSSTESTAWTVTFDTQEIPEIPAGQEVQVTANVTPADKAVAGDYMVTIKAQPSEGATQSTDFRITVLTSTLWGVAGVGLIAVAVGVVALAVVRFGRR